MQCNKCGSDNTQRLEVIYEQGTSNINTTSYTAGGGFSGLFGMGGAATTTSGTQQTAMGQKAAPPAKKSYKWPVIGMIIGLYALAITQFMSVILVIIAGFFIFRAYQYNANVWPDLYHYWQESWLCNKCGNIYHHPAH